MWPNRDGPKVRFHDLRHTHATLLLHAKVPMKVVQERLRHTHIMTTMGIYARRHGIDMKGATVHVTKEMVSQPSRRIGKLGVKITVPQTIAERERKALEKAGLSCPVHASLRPEVEIPVEFVWGKG